MIAHEWALCRDVRGPILPAWSFEGDPAGTDPLSIAAFSTPTATYQILQEADVGMVEGLTPGQVVPGVHGSVCLPILIHGSNWSPARAVVRRMAR